jgi:UDP-N-acetylglucosamine transferase subunit ALG13
MIFLTVGTQFPFDRLVRAVDEAFDNGLIDEEVFAQIGETSYRPHNFESVASLGEKVFDERLKQASSVIGHAGIGTITTALDNHKPLLVMPRLKKHGEVVNDHQVAIARKFEELGHILVAYDVKDLPDSIKKLKNFIPRKRKSDPEAVANRIRRFLDSLQNQSRADLMTKRKNMRVCLAASAGGHLTQLLKVAQSWSKYESFFITTSNTVREKLGEYGNVYIVGECNRQHPLRVIAVLMRCLKIVLRERPNVVISTGAAAGCITCFLGWLSGAKIIWLDSITNVDRLSLSGRMVRYIADVFLVQWPELAKKYNNVEYLGAVI